jgi:hypothetical protein
VATLDDQIATYLTAADVEGKTRNSCASYANSLRDMTHRVCS